MDTQPIWFRERENFTAACVAYFNRDFDKGSWLDRADQVLVLTPKVPAVYPDLLDVKYARGSDRGGRARAQRKAVKDVSFLALRSQRS